MTRRTTGQGEDAGSYGWRSQEGGSYSATQRPKMSVRE